MTEQAPTGDHGEEETASDEAPPSLAELHDRLEALTALITDHFNLLKER
ncbi:hypothetical protein PJ985_01720 [Streptomyces sp. ACA25]|nr:hypothetical protein [Streptomyces sp. ACA25]MDB1086290.1 hypothetical protein [Streptomyces sp. ACA25]